MTAQLQGSCPQALQVAIHSQQVALLGESYSSAEVHSAYSRAPVNKAVCLFLHLEYHV